MKEIIRAAIIIYLFKAKTAVLESTILQDVVLRCNPSGKYPQKNYVKDKTELFHSIISELKAGHVFYMISRPEINNGEMHYGLNDQVVNSADPEYIFSKPHSQN